MTRSPRTVYSRLRGAAAFRSGRCGKRDAVTRTVDLGVIGEDRAALAAAVDAVQHGRRVLAVLRSGGAQAAQRFRRCLRRAPECGRQAAYADDERRSRLR